uniref:Olfactory receptor n=1 Tax=Sphenodon punctatus TaxID=8508 RepID=A0A8D0GEH3_SPHPU
MSRRGENQTLALPGFIILGFSDSPRLLRLFFFAFFSAMYAATLAGNLLIVALAALDPALRTPMYFFLGSLSSVELAYTLVIVPKMLVGFLALTLDGGAISFVGCAAQMYFFIALGASECFLLAAMAYDRYIAICHPLHYPVIMSRQACVRLLVGSCAGGFLLSLGLTGLVFQLPFCHSRLVNHVFCDIPAVLKLACTDTYINELVIFAVAVMVLIVPLSLVFVSYSHIVATILRMNTAAGRRKTFSTCASHLIVVSLFYGAAIFMYMRPRSTHSPQQDKMISLFYAVITPMVNPMIYSLRNKEVKSAVMRALGKKTDS